MRDVKTGEFVEVEDDGRRIELSVRSCRATHVDGCCCMCEPPEAVIALDKAELLALLQGGGR